MQMAIKELPKKGLGRIETYTIPLVCASLEAKGELRSLSEVHDKMTEIAKLNESENLYSQKWLQTKIQRPHILC